MRPAGGFFRSKVSSRCLGNGGPPEKGSVVGRTLQAVTELKRAEELLLQRSCVFWKMQTGRAGHCICCGYKQLICRHFNRHGWGVRTVPVLHAWNVSGQPEPVMTPPHPCDDSTTPHLTPAKCQRPSNVPGLLEGADTAEGLEIHTAGTVKGTRDKCDSDTEKQGMWAGMLLASP